MNIDELEESLTIEGKQNKSFLIDGNWGIGKTTYIKGYLKNKKSIYVSLFGIKDSQELENNLFLELKNLNETTNKICNFYQPANLKNGTFKTDLNNILKEDIYIVIDDLEKKSDKITYKELFGLIAALRDINHFRIILIGDTTRISINNFEIFKNLKDVVIDKTYHINYFSNKIINMIINDTKILKPSVSFISKEKFENYLYSYIEKYNIKNIRTIKKSIEFSATVINHLDKDKLTQFDIETIINISFSIIVEKNDHNSYDKDHLLKTIVTEYMSDIKYPLSREDLVNSIIAIYEYPAETYFAEINNYFEQVESCRQEQKTQKEPKLFYLSSDKIEKKIARFIKTSILKYNSKYNIVSWYNQLYEYYFYSRLIDKYIIKKEDVIKILEKYIDAIDCNEVSLFTILLRMQHETDATEDALSIFKIIKDKIVYKYFMYHYNKASENFDNNIYDSRVIADLITFVLATDFKSNDDIDTIVSLLRNKNLFLPNLNDEISDEIWNYVHEIWKGISASDESQNKRKLLNLLIEISNDIYQSSNGLGKYRITKLNEYYNILKL